MDKNKTLEDSVREIADAYAVPEKKGELQSVLRMLVGKANMLQVKQIFDNVSIHKDIACQLSVPKNEKEEELKKKFNLE